MRSISLSVLKQMVQDGIRTWDDLAASGSRQRYLDNAEEDASQVMGTNLLVLWENP